MQTIMFTKLFRGVALAEVAATIRDIGFDGVDLLIRDGHQVVPSDPGAIGPAVALLRQHGLTVPLATTDIFDPADPAAEPVFAACAEAGIGMIRLGYYRYDPPTGYHAKVDAARRRLEGLEQLAEKTGVRLMLQSHGRTIHASGAQCAVLLRDRDPRFVGAYADPGNQAMQEGREDWRFTLEVLAPWLGCLGVKNGGWSAGPRNPSGQRGWSPAWFGLTEGMVPWDEIVAHLKATGFAGVLTLHSQYDMPFAQAVDQTRADARYIRRLLAG